MNKIKYLLFIVAFLSAFSCAKEEPLYTVPYAPVYFRVDINGLDSDLTYFTHKSYLTGRTIGEQVGFGGLLVFRDNEGKVFAFDLSCPNERLKDVRVVPADNGEAVCPKCKKKYVFWTGTGHEAQGGAPLQRYRVLGSTQSGVFHIRN